MLRDRFCVKISFYLSDECWRVNFDFRLHACTSKPTAASLYSVPFPRPFSWRYGQCRISSASISSASASVASRFSTVVITIAGLDLKSSRTSLKADVRCKKHSYWYHYQCGSRYTTATSRRPSPSPGRVTFRLSPPSLRRSARIVWLLPALELPLL